MYMTLQMYDRTEYLGRVSEVRLGSDMLAVRMADGSQRLYLARLVVGMTVLDGEAWRHEVC